MNIITGLERSKGDFVSEDGKTIPYDNTLIYFITDTSRKTTGFKSCVIKAKTKVLTEILGCDASSLPLLLNNQSVDFILDLSVSPPTVEDLIIYGEGITIKENKK